MQFVQADAGTLTDQRIGLGRYSPSGAMLATRNVGVELIEVTKHCGLGGSPAPLAGAYMLMIIYGVSAGSRT